MTSHYFAVYCGDIGYGLSLKEAWDNLKTGCSVHLSDDDIHLCKFVKGSVIEVESTTVTTIIEVKK